MTLVLHEKNTDLKRRSIMKPLLSCSAIALLCGALSTPFAMAQSTPATPAKPAAAATPATPAADTKQNDSNANDAGKSEQNIEATIVKLGERIELTAEQKTKIESVLSADRGTIAETWSKYANEQMKMIRLEAEMVAAMDDVLEPQQQEHVAAKREQKDQAAAAHKSAKPTTTDSQAKPTADSSQPKSNEATAKAQPDKQAPAVQTASANKSAESGKKPAADTNKDGKTDADEEVVWTMVIVPVREEYIETGMSDTQAVQCDEISQSYHKELVQVYQKVRGLHQQLVRFEAKEITQIESVLTPEQIKQLKEERKQASPAQASSTSTKS